VFSGIPEQNATLSVEALFCNDAPGDEDTLTAENVVDERPNCGVDVTWVHPNLEVFV
jgi:hypothetical protein